MILEPKKETKKENWQLRYQSTSPSPLAEEAAKKENESSATGIPTWSPTVVLTGRYDACLGQSGRDAKFSSFYGRTHLLVIASSSYAV